jgi:hypothetical protein
MRNFLLSAAVTAVAIGVSIGGAWAAPVLTPDGDPFPSDSVAYLTGGPYMTPFGTFDMTTVANFDGFVLQNHGGNEFYTYATSSLLGTTGPSQTVTFDNHGVFSTFTLTNGDVEVEIFGRSSAFETGMFDARILMGLDWDHRRHSHSRPDQSDNAYARNDHIFHSPGGEAGAPG